MGSVAEEPPTLPAGTLIAPGYEALEHLRRGNELDVYDAWSVERGCRCIVKTTRPDRIGDEKTCANLLQEGVLLKRLCHPHLVRGYDVLESPAPVVAMETLTGQTLDHLIDSGDDPLEPPEAAQLGLQLASVAGYLHLQGFLHLDIKPDNMIVEGGRAKLIDLNLARAPGEAPDGIGTWCYMSPEQARGGELTAAADVWGIGVTLYEALSGIDAFDGEEEFPQLTRAAPDLAEIRELPEELTGLVGSCLEAEPAERPSLPQLIQRLVPVAGISTPKSSGVAPGDAGPPPSPGEEAVR